MPETIHETANYRVTVESLELTETPDAAMRRKFLVVDRKYGVIYGVSGSRASAIIAAEAAETELEEMEKVMREMKSRTPQFNVN